MVRQGGTCGPDGFAPWIDPSQTPRSMSEAPHPGKGGDTPEVRADLSAFQVEVCLLKGQQ